MTFDFLNHLLGRRAQPEPQVQTTAKPEPTVDMALEIVRRLGIRPSTINGVDQSLDVKVTAPRPTSKLPMSATDEGSEMMERITLGTSTEAPLGFHNPETSRTAPSGESLPPAFRKAWEAAIERWPHATKYIDAIDVADDGDSYASYDPINNRISFSSRSAQEDIDHSTLMSVLAHELTHAGQRRSAGSVLKNARQWELHPFRDYEDRLGEEQGSDAQASVLQNFWANRRPK